MEGLSLDRREMVSLRKHGVDGSSCWHGGGRWQ